MLNPKLFILLFCFITIVFSSGFKSAINVGILLDVTYIPGNSWSKEEKSMLYTTKGVFIVEGNVLKNIGHEVWLAECADETLSICVMDRFRKSSKCYSVSK